MSNTELINAYFDNELNASEKKMFEDRLARDTELQREYKFQEDVIEGIREARRQSLKARLNQVQVGGAATGGSSWTAGKIAGLIILAAAAGFGIYYFYPESEPQLAETPAIIEEPIRDEATQTPVTPEQQDTNKDEEPVGETPPVVNETTEAGEKTDEVPAREESETNVQEEVKNPVVAPSFEDPKGEETEIELPTGDISGKAVVASDNLEVAVENDSRRFDFHYALENDRLTLYGNFEEDLYEILEFNTADMKAWFLSFNGEYYRLEPTEGKVERLEKVTDNRLLQTLKEASGN